MAENEELDPNKKYLNVMNKIIKSGNPKYVSYVSREYMKLKDSDPQTALALFVMMQKASQNKESIYNIFMDNDGTVNLDAVDDIARIQNMDEFVDTIQRISGHSVDFSDFTSDDLIKEGEQIAQELEQEAIALENEINGIEIDEDGGSLDSVESEVESKSSDLLAKASLLAVIGGSIAAVVNRLKSSFSNMRNRISGKKVEADNMKKKSEEKEEDLNSDGKVSIGEKALNIAGKVLETKGPKSDIEYENFEDMVSQNKDMVIDANGDGIPDDPSLVNISKHGLNFKKDEVAEEQLREQKEQIKNDPSKTGKSR